MLHIPREPKATNSLVEDPEELQTRHPEADKTSSSGAVALSGGPYCHTGCSLV